MNTGYPFGKEKVLSSYQRIDQKKLDLLVLQFEDFPIYKNSYALVNTPDQSTATNPVSYLRDEQDNLEATEVLHHHISDNGQEEQKQGDIKNFQEGKENCSKMQNNKKDNEFSQGSQENILAYENQFHISSNESLFIIQEENVQIAEFPNSEESPESSFQEILQNQFEHFSVKDQIQFKNFQILNFENQDTCPQ